MPLPRDVLSLLELSETRSPTPTISLVLERVCAPWRQVALAPNDLEARFLLASAKQSLKSKLREEAIATLQKAIALAPKQPDLRLLLARTAISDGKNQEAERVIKDGMATMPLQTYWGLLEDPVLAPLSSRLVPPTPTNEPILRGVDLALHSVAWSPSMRQVAFINQHWNLVVFSKDGAEVFSAPIALGADLDDDGDLRRSSRATVARRVARADQVLRALGFQSVKPSQRVSADVGTTDSDLSHIRWKELGIVASAGRNVLRVRREGQVIFERRLEISGEARLAWGAYLAESKLLLLAWDSRAGNDECPNLDGVEMVELSSRH
jgi:hypothetical protein